MKSVWFVVCMCALLSACGGSSGIFSRKLSAIAVLAPTKDNSVSGTVSFAQKGDVVVVEAAINGLKANGTHGIHIHEKGNCRAADASSAGAHFNPATSRHGGPAGTARHAGDLGNLIADANGSARMTIEIDGASLSAGANSIIGRSVIVHASADDLQTQPSGNSGARVACGLIGKNPDKLF